MRYPYAGRSRVAQSAERPAVNRQVIGSSPIAGATRSLIVSPLTCIKAGREGLMAHAAPVRTKIPTKSPQPARRGLPACPGEGPPRRARPGPRERDRAPGHPRRPPGDRAGVRDHRVPGPRGAGPVAGGLARERQAAAVRGGVRGEAGRQAGEGHRAAGSRCAQHDAPRCGPDRVLPVRRPAPGPAAVVPQARAYPAPAVRAVRRPGHRRGPLPGHHDQAHAADRQRRAHRQGRATGSGA